MLLEHIPQIVSMFRLQWEEAQDCYVLLYPEGMVQLSKSAGEIMKRIDGVRTIGAIINDLNTVFPDAKVDADVADFLDKAHENGWIEI